jgi:beta-glucosidase
MTATNINLDGILSQLSLEEKVALTSAESWWRTEIIWRGDKILVPHIKVAQGRQYPYIIGCADNLLQTIDGPNGARGESYVSGVKSACFPCSTCIGATFDPDIAFQIGKGIAKEAKSKSADILLAPTVNNIRSPLGKIVNQVS